MAKNTRKDEAEETQAATSAEPPAGGSGGNTGQAPISNDDFLTEQDKAGLDKSIGGGPKDEPKGKGK